jgi:hypothetical protein
MKVSQKTGKTVRLPTEAEWEYACRAGSKTSFCYGDDDDFKQLDDYAWYWRDMNSKRTTHPVGQKKPNAWGLYDMHGNVRQWCGDWYDKTYYANAKTADPTGPDSGTLRVQRGGSWAGPPVFSRSASRGGWDPNERGTDFGFRVVLELRKPPAEGPPSPDAIPPSNTATSQPGPALHLGGKIVKVDGTNVTIMVRLHGVQDHKEVTVLTDDKTVVEIDQQEAKLSDLKPDMWVRITPKEGTATKIVAWTKLPIRIPASTSIDSSKEAPSTAPVVGDGTGAKPSSQPETKGPGDWRKDYYVLVETLQKKWEEMKAKEAGETAAQRQARVKAFWAWAKYNFVGQTVDWPGTIKEITVEKNRRTGTVIRADFQINGTKGEDSISYSYKKVKWLSEQQAQKIERNAPARIGAKITSIETGFGDGTFRINIDDFVTVKVVKEP